MADRQAFDAYVRERWEPLLRTAALLTGDAARRRGPRAGVPRAGRPALAPGRPGDGSTPTCDGSSTPARSTPGAGAGTSRTRSTTPCTTSGPAADERGGLDARLTLVDALRRLTPRQRAVLVARFYEDRTEVDTARVLGCSVSTVKSQTRHALERLRVLAPELAATFGREETLR